MPAKLPEYSRTPSAFGRYSRKSRGNSGDELAGKKPDPRQGSQRAEPTVPTWYVQKAWITTKKLIAAET